MKISDMIADFINTMIEHAGGVVELQRSEIAEHFNCVPSQINYVIDTRFSPEHGFYVESRRGGGGYIRISRVNLDRPVLFMHTINAVGGEIDVHSSRALISNLCAQDLLHPETAAMLSAVLSERALYDVPPEFRAEVRARLLKTAMMSIASGKGQ